MARGREGARQGDKGGKSKQGELIEGKEEEEEEEEEEERER